MAYEFRLLTLLEDTEEERKPAALETVDLKLPVRFPLAAAPEARDRDGHLLEATPHTCVQSLKPGMLLEIMVEGLGDNVKPAGESTD